VVALEPEPEGLETHHLQAHLKVLLEAMVVMVPRIMEAVVVAGQAQLDPTALQHLVVMAALALHPVLADLL
jgi:hypothetical protein